MKAFYRKTFSICLFMAVLLMIVGTALAYDNSVAYDDIADESGKSLTFTGEICAGG